MNHKLLDYKLDLEKAKKPEMKLSRTDYRKNKRIPEKTSAAAAKSLQSCPTLCDPIDGSPPGSSVHGIFQLRVLEWGAIAFSDIMS